jgi:hypothetical protein
MRLPAILTVGLAATFAFAGSPARADEGYRHGRLRFAEPGTTLQRATETEAEEAIQNLPFLPGDRIWTDASGRAEFQFPDGTVARLDRRGKLDYAGHEEEPEERIVLRLWSGSVLVHAPSQASLLFEVETPAGLVDALEKSVVRVDVQGGDTRVSVYDGEAGFAGMRLALGERVEARWGERPSEPESFDRFEGDDFLQWDQDRESETRWAASSARYLPDDLDDYSGELDRNGTWRYDGDVSGYVWVPYVDAGWQPYSNGQWSWTPYGWTWVPYESWGWAPFHYGRWGFNVSLGWYWIPGRTWGPAWVSWAVGGGYAAWCPLGWRDRPVSPWGYWGAGYRGHADRGHAVPRDRYGRDIDTWHVVRRGELGRGDPRSHRVDATRIDPGVVHVAESPLLRPTRDVAVLRPSDPAPRAIRTRMTPGDFVRELSVDNKTTIPAPWTRGYGPPPAGAEGARYGTPKRTGSSDPQESRSPAGAVPRGVASTPADPGVRDTGGVAASPRSNPRPAPAYLPPTSAPSEGGTANTSSSGAERRAPAGQGTAADRPQREYSYRSGGVSAAPRGEGTSGNGAARRDTERTTRPAPGEVSRSNDSGSRRPQSDGARPRAESAGRSQGDGGNRGHGDGAAPRASAPAPRSNGATHASGGGKSGGGGSHPRPHQQ